MPLYVSTLLVVVGGYVFFVLFAWLAADGILFQPRPTSYATLPGLVKLRAPDGVSVCIDHQPSPAARYTILYFHGNAEDLGDLQDHFAALRAHGFSAVGLDYRGYGMSDGTPNEANVYADAALAFRYVVDELHVPPERLILYGRSLGGGPAIDIATREPVAGLVLDSCFISAFRVITGVPLIPGDRFPNLAKISRVHCPVLVMHGVDDRTVPFSHGEKLFAAAPEPKRFFPIAGAGHNNLVDVATSRYWDALTDFANSLQK